MYFIIHKQNRKETEKGGYDISTTIAIWRGNELRNNAAGYLQ